MDAEKLIREVFIKESLWNQAHPDHHNRFILEKQWEEIGKNMNATKDAVKNKWKYLRDTFRKELAKCKKPRSGDAGGVATESKWTYFKLLMFLRDQFIPRKSFSNLTGHSSSTEIPLEVSQSQDENEENIDIESNVSEQTEQQTFFSGTDSDSQIIHVDLPSTSTSTYNEGSEEPRVVLPRKKRKRSPDHVGEALLKVEREKLALLQNKSNKPSLPMDEDRCFFESILPHVQKMNPIKKLQFRNKLQELVMFYAYDYSDSSSHSTTLTPLGDNTSVTPTSFTFAQPWHNFEN